MMSNRRLNTVFGVLCFLVLLRLGQQKDFNSLEEDYDEDDYDVDIGELFSFFGTPSCDCGIFSGSRIELKNKQYEKLGLIAQKTYSQLCKVRDVETNEIRTMELFDSQKHPKYFIEDNIKYHKLLNESSHVINIYDWDTRDKCVKILTDFYEIREYQDDETREIGKGILHAMNDIHKRGMLLINVFNEGFYFNESGHVYFTDFRLTTKIHAANEKHAFSLRPFYIDVSSPEVSTKRKRELMLVRIFNVELASMQEKKIPRSKAATNNFTQDLLEFYKQEVFRLVLISQYDTIDTATDVWSACSILYSMMYGRSPYDYYLNNNLQISNHLPFVDNLKKMDVMATTEGFQIIFPPHPDLLLRNTLQKCLVRDVNKRPTVDELLQTLAEDREMEFDENRKKKQANYFGEL